MHKLPSLPVVKFDAILAHAYSNKLLLCNVLLLRKDKNIQFEILKFFFVFCIDIAYCMYSDFAVKERNTYLPLAESGSRMYFVISDLAKINNMYRFSLASFLRIFQKALKAKQVEGKAVESGSNLYRLKSRF